MFSKAHAALSSENEFQARRRRLELSGVWHYALLGVKSFPYPMQGAPNFSSPAPSGRSRRGCTVGAWSMTPEQARAFDHAESEYEVSHMQASGQRPPQR
jgi:hypothetical protein